MITQTVDLPTEQYERLKNVAIRRGVTLQDLLCQLAEECVTRDEAVDTASKYVLTKNAELYRRLAV